jgi:hypothetical protein
MPLFVESRICESTTFEKRVGHRVIGADFESGVFLGLRDHIDGYLLLVEFVTVKEAEIIPEAGKCDCVRSDLKLLANYELNSVTRSAGQLDLCIYGWMAANISASSRLLHTPPSPLLQSNLPVEAFVNRV